MTADFRGSRRCLALDSVRREDDPDCRAAVWTGIDAHAAAQRASTLRNCVEARAPPLPGRVVRDHGLDASARDLADAHRNARRRTTANRLMDRFPDDLVDRDLSVLGKRLRALDLEVDLDAVRHAELVRQRPNRRSEALVAKHDRLELEREVAQRADRLALLLERRAQDAVRLLGPAGLDRGADGVEHERDPGHRLQGAVVKDQSKPPALFLLGCDQLVGKASVLRREALDLLPDPLVPLLLADQEEGGERSRATDSDEQSEERQPLSVQAEPEQREHRTGDHDANEQAWSSR